MPRIEGLIQNSPEWHAYRQCHIMATSSSCIMGTNPYRSSLDVWEEMLGLKPPVEMNDAMRRGQEREPEARKFACEIIGIEFEPCVYQCDKYDWMAASLDGISPNLKMFPTNHAILEIKCPGEKTHAMALADLMPEYYRSQIQHQLAVTNAEIAYYFSYRPENPKKFAVIEVYPDREYIERMIEKEKEFWIRLCTMQPPEKPWEFGK